VEVALDRQESDRPRRALFATLVVLVLWAGGSEALSLRRERGQIMDYAWKQLPMPRLRSTILTGGVKVLVPLNGDQCWGAPAPCSPEIGTLATLHRSSFLGHTMYSHGAPNSACQMELKSETPPGESPFVVVIGPAVWGEEPATRVGKTYRVRWVRNDTEFTVDNETGRSREVVLSFDIATFGQPRHVRLVENGRKLPLVYEVTQEFWGEGPQTLRFEANLNAGRNPFSLSTDEPAGKLPGNRVACLLLVGDVRVEFRK